jgi:hypothetical protein
LKQNTSEKDRFPHNFSPEINEQQVSHQASMPAAPINRLQSGDELGRGFLAIGL